MVILVFGKTVPFDCSFVAFPQKFKPPANELRVQAQPHFEGVVFVNEGLQ